MRELGQSFAHSEIRFQRVQAIWLTLGVVVALGLMFALGLTVGRRAARLAPQTAQNPLAEIEANGKMHEQLRFYDRLTQAPVPVKTRPPVAAPDPTPSAAPTAKPQPAPPEVAAAKPAPETEPKAQNLTENTEPRTSEAKTSEAKTTASEAGADRDAIRAALDQGPATHGEYTVQVSSFQTEREANAAAASLRRRGFAPFVVSAAVAGKGTWYRVRLGRFTSLPDASRAKSILAGADIPAWVLKVK
jgi:DedD protein